MNRIEIVNQMNEKYNSFLDYMDGLSSEDYSFRFEQKWSAAQQLEHIVLCVKPLVRLFGMSNTTLEQNFRKTERSSRSYLELKKEYLEKTGGSGKAPERYVPEDSLTISKNELIKKLKSLIEALNAAIQKQDEHELETYLVPHPLLGEITLKEMLYNAIYHVEHHQLQVERNLKGK